MPIESIDDPSIRRLLELVTDEELEALLAAESAGDGGRVVVAATRRLARTRATSWFSKRQHTLRAEREARTGFQRRLHEWPWGPAFDALDLMIIKSRRAGSRHVSRNWREVRRDNDLAFDAVARLHRRAVLVATEAAVLMKAGLASGAHARWRTLHELAIVAMFIREQGSEVAERYLLHQHIQRARTLAKLRDSGESFLGELPPQDEQDELEAVKAELIGRYGRAYAADYGWASEALRDPNPGLGDLEKAVAGSHWRPYVDMATHGVHAGARALYWDLGMPAGMETAPAGSTNMGMSDPGQSTALSLQLATVALLVLRADIDSLTEATALGSLAEWTRDVFAAQGQLHDVTVEAEKAARTARRRARRSRLEFVAAIERLPGGWAVEIDELHLAIQVDRRRDIEAAARGAVAELTGIPAERFDVRVVWRSVPA